MTGWLKHWSIDARSREQPSAAEVAATAIERHNFEAGLWDGWGLASCFFARVWCTAEFQHGTATEITP
jgi:hypothetical protein